MFNAKKYWMPSSFIVSCSVYVCYYGSVSDWEVSGWRAANSEDSEEKSNVNNED